MIGLFGGGDDDWKEDCIGTVGCRTFLTFSLGRECQVESTGGISYDKDGNNLKN